MKNTPRGHRGEEPLRDIIIPPHGVCGGSIVWGIDSMLRNPCGLQFVL